MKLTRAELLTSISGYAASFHPLVRAQAADSRAIQLPGVNLAGGEFGSVAGPNVLGSSHIYPANEAFTYWAKRGMRNVRLPFRIERLQPVAFGPADLNEISEIDRCVTAAERSGLVIVLDAHNFGQRGAAKLDSADLAAFWSLMANRYKHASHVAYGLMNEPFVFEAAEWRCVLDKVCAAIRSITTTQCIMVPGSGWSGAHSFVNHGDAAAFRGFSDPNFMVEVHQYLDHDSSGQHVQNYVPGAGSTRLRTITDWARQQRWKLYLGEFGFAMPAGEVETRAMLAFMTTNSDVWAGYSVWAGGPLWGDYAFSVEPDHGVDKPHIALMQSFFTN